MVPLLQDTVRWMEEKEIVQRMLRANLHQRQYVEQVGNAQHGVCSSVGCRQPVDEQYLL